MTSGVLSVKQITEFKKLKLTLMLVVANFANTKWILTVNLSYGYSSESTQWEQGYYLTRWPRVTDKQCLVSQTNNWIPKKQTVEVM